MKDLKENLETRLAEMNYGEIQVIPMIDRGPYRELDLSENLDRATAAFQSDSGELLSLAAQLVNTEEDFISVQRTDQDMAMKQADFDWYVEKLKAPKHLILVNCIDLGTSEIRNFLLELLAAEKLPESKVFLLDLPQLEYLTIRDSLAGKIKM